MIFAVLRNMSPRRDLKRAHPSRPHAETTDARKCRGMVGRTLNHEGPNKNLHGRVKTKEIMRVLFSSLEGSDQPAYRAS